MYPQTLVHIRREQGKHTPEHVPQNRHGRQHRRGIHGIRVDEIVDNPHVHDDHTEPERDQRCDAGHPVHGGGVRPREPEEAHGDCYGGDHARRQTCFRRCEAIMPFLDSDVPLVIHDGVDHRGKHAHQHAQERKAADAGVPAAFLLVDDGEGGEEHVEGSVDGCGVEGEEEDDWFVEEQYPWPCEYGLQAFAYCHFLFAHVEFTPVVFSGYTGEPGGAFAEKDWGVGLWD